MDRVYQANAIETPPSTIASSGSYPTAGNKALGQLATVPGPYWFYSITEEIRNALIAAGVTPDAAKVNQLAEALGKFLPLSGGTMVGTITSAVLDALVRNGTNSELRIHGATNLTDGGSLVLYGKDATLNAGGALIRVTDGTKTKDLMVLPDGTLTWGGENVVCVESWHSGANWYRKYSDGWIEQGGVAYTNSSFIERQNATITFNKAFSNTNYTVVTNPKMGSDGARVASANYVTKGTSNVTCFVYWSNNNGANFMTSYPFDWYACGY